PVEEAAPEPAEDAAPEPAPEPAETDEVEATETDDAEVEVEQADGATDSVAEYAAEIEQRLSTPEPPAPDAEHMSPDPVVVETEVVEADEDGADDEFEAVVLEEPDDTPDLDDLDAEAALAADETDDALATDRDELPSYLRSTSAEPLFGGQVADDVAAVGERGDADDDLVDAEADEEYDEPRRMSSVVHGLWIVGQSIFAVVFGAGLFVAFDQLWKWNNIVALVLSVLVILGLVVAVRVVRKTEDIGSTLIAVAVGALVTLGPLALLQSG
ncbi:hypothetical protein ACQI4F_25435, partial [Mycolicibacterium vaccae]|uniref:hypothetical protein n=1 Tax=Mycolicibacterium vaccae TaxID=1810 RepID=UPI003CEB51B9